MVALLAACLTRRDRLLVHLLFESALRPGEVLALWLEDVDIGPQTVRVVDRGELLLFALCAQPFAPGFDSRVPLLDACEAHVPASLLVDTPEGGFSPAELHERLDGTPYAAAAECADWVWAETDTVFLDFDEEIEVVDADWTCDIVLELAAQWRKAEGILDRIDHLASWLEADPPGHFSQLLDALRARDAHLAYERTRRQYACEITEAGLVPIDHDADAIAVPLGAAGRGGA